MSHTAGVEVRTEGRTSDTLWLVRRSTPGGGARAYGCNPYATACLTELTSETNVCPDAPFPIRYVGGYHLHSSDPLVTRS